MIKGLFCSDSRLVPTGFGNQIDGILNYLAYMYASEYDLHHLGFQYPGREITYNNCKMHSSGTMRFGADIMPFLVNETIQPDFVFTLADIWMVAPFANSRRRAPWVMYFPIDGYNQLTPDSISVLKSVEYPVVMSKFGKNLCDEAEVAVDYVPHGLDIHTFYRKSDEERRNLREIYGIPEDKFVILTVSRPNPRKRLDLILNTLNNLSNKYDNFIWYLHSDLNFDDFLIADEKAEKFKESFFSHPLYKRGMFRVSVYNYRAGIPDRQLNELYNLADAYLLLHGGEGFGITPCQAGLTGCPSIMTDCSTTQELIGGRGVCVPARKYEADDKKIPRPVADINAAADALFALAIDEGLRKEYGKKCMDFFKNYAWENIIKKWHKIFTKASADDVNICDVFLGQEKIVEINA